MNDGSKSSVFEFFQLLLDIQSKTKRKFQRNLRDGANSDKPNKQVVQKQNIILGLYEKFSLGIIGSNDYIFTIGQNLTIWFLLFDCFIVGYSWIFVINIRLIEVYNNVNW